MKKYFYYLLVLLAMGCKERYNPPFTSPETGYLVVEGIIINGTSPTQITISRTNALTSYRQEFETRAQVKVEGDDNSSFLLPETGVGIYRAQLNLDATKQYRLHVKTEGGKEILSDFVPVKATPAIDSISWTREIGSGVQLYINAHDPSDNTRYYQWGYTETWEYHAAFRSVLKYGTRTLGNGEIVPTIEYIDPVNMTADTTVFKCWKYNAPTTILIGSTAKLSKDVVFEPLLYIEPRSIKMSVLYSINVQQYAITKEAYEFLEKMKKNTEQNGSVFDPQPSELKGNIHCVSNPDEPVIGYISVASLAEKRIFISNRDLPEWIYRSGCVEISIPNNKDSIEKAMDSDALPSTEAGSAANPLERFNIAAPPCVNCTLNGTNVKPSFWP